MSRLDLVEFDTKHRHRHSFLFMLEYSKTPYIRTLNFLGQAAIGSYLAITISNIRLSGS